ncbi:DUF222 domain-containing protein [Pseudonocardia hispaniensis]|uniref:DUF222 domain-containing protein n=1 Tax=Pseudonocardia hispaniensis TaxID=904933 RepID=UPI0036D353DB
MFDTWSAVSARRGVPGPGIGLAPGVWAVDPPSTRPEPDARPAGAGFAPSGWAALELELGTADPAALDDTALVEAVAGFHRLMSWAGARQARLLAEFARRRPADPADMLRANEPSVGSPFAPDEIGCALAVSRGWATVLLAQATALAGPLHAVRDAYERGELDATKVRALYEATLYLEPDRATAVAARVLPKAGGQSLAQLRAALRRAIIAVDPDGATRRHRRARRDRRVTVQAREDGMASLWALLSAPDAYSAYEWLTRLARGLGSGDSRGMDARRADLLRDLLTGRLTAAPDPADVDLLAPENGDAQRTTGDPDRPSTDPEADATATPESAPGAAATGSGRMYLRPVSPGKPLIQVVVPYPTLTGQSDEPCELRGYGAIPADMARELAADAVWHRLLTDPASGALLDYGRTTYHPPAALADHVRARDGYCREPMCMRPAAGCELDHVIRFPDGPTAAANIDSKCQHGHKLKHHAGWQTTLHPDGRVTWTTPTGHVYTSEPYDYRTDTELAALRAECIAAVAAKPEPEPPPAPDDPPPF